VYQFFVEPEQIDLDNKRVTITGGDVNHIKNVLRMQLTEEIDVRNGIDTNEYRCSIAGFETDAVICDLLFVREDSVELPSKVYLFQGLPKSDKMEFIIQKAVELGVHEIIPVATSRSVVKLDAKKEKSKLERYNAIALAAAKQCKRAYIPKVTQVMSMKEAVSYAKEMDVRVIPYELADGMKKTKDIIASLKGNEQIAVFIGPEGGFAKEEIELAQNAGIEPVTLGKRILRTETAGITILSIIMFQLEQ